MHGVIYKKAGVEIKLDKDLVVENVIYIIDEYNNMVEEKKGREHENIKHKRNNSSFITLTDGSVIKYHPSFRFLDHIFQKFNPEDRQALLDSRA